MSSTDLSQLVLPNNKIGHSDQTTVRRGKIIAIDKSNENEVELTTQEEVKAFLYQFIHKLVDPSSLQYHSVSLEVVVQLVLTISYLAAYYYYDGFSFLIQSYGIFVMQVVFICYQMLLIIRLGDISERSILLNRSHLVFDQPLPSLQLGYLSTHRLSETRIRRHFLLESIEGGVSTLFTYSVFLRLTSMGIGSFMTYRLISYRFFNSLFTMWYPTIDILELMFLMIYPIMIWFCLICRMLASLGIRKDFLNRTLPELRKMNGGVIPW